MAENYSFEYTKDEKCLLSKKLTEEIIELADKIETETEEVDLQVKSIFGSKHTYCCVMSGSDGRPLNRRQFRAYSFQAPFFCIRMASSSGYSSGSVSRGRCEEDEPS